MPPREALRRSLSRATGVLGDRTVQLVPTSPTAALSPRPGTTLPGVAVDVTVETVIARPVDEVAAYAADPGHAPEWYANIRSVEWQTPPPVAVGSRRCSRGGGKRTHKGPGPRYALDRWPQRGLPSGHLQSSRTR